MSHLRRSLTGLAFLSCLATPASSSPTQGTSPSVGVSPENSRCTALLGRTIGGAKVEKTDFIVAGADLNSFGVKTTGGVCRVLARLSPAPDSSIGVEIWLPTDWNGKMFGYGGSGTNGNLTTGKGFLAGPVRDGYASVVTDAGHAFSFSSKWALGHPEKIVDFGSRANHLGILAAKTLARLYYGKPSGQAYFMGCSNGGRDALMLAQRHPEDYDGIISGAPAYNWTATFAMYLHNQRISQPRGGSGSIVPKLGLVHDAVLKRCDAGDGAVDRLISNPATCRFDPRELQCRPGATSVATCLTPQEVASVSAVYRGVRGRDGRVIMPGYPVGSEKEWGPWFASSTSAAASAAADYYRNIVYGNPAWSAAGFALDRDYPEATRRVGPTLNATDTDLRPFLSRGGLLLMYHGWNDGALPAQNTIDYFKAMRRATGRSATGRTRLFLVPGMAHCSGGDGPDTFGALGALDQWSQKGEAPQQLIVSKYENSQYVAWGKQMPALSSRLMCAWPKSPRYTGRGRITEASAFECR